MKLPACIRILPALLPLLTAPLRGDPVTEALAPSRIVPSGNYRIAEHDVVQFKVYQEADLDTTARVSKDGTIAFPLIGTVQIGGRTAEEAAQVVQIRLREYLVQPQVTIRITEYSKRRFTVLGQVSRPGTYDFPDEGKVNLLEAIGMAGGFTRSAKPSRVTLKRVGKNGQETTFELDAKSMAVKKDSPRFEVLPGDTIAVAESLF